MSSSASSIPSAIAGNESVTRLIHRMCMGENSINPLSVAINSAMTSLKFEGYRLRKR